MVEALRSLKVPLRFEELDAGDYAVEGVRLERLTADEFARLVAEGRLLEVADKLAAGGRPVIVVEGDWCMEGEQAARALAELVLRVACLVRTRGPEETAHVVYAFYRRRAAHRRRSYLQPSKVRRGGSKPEGGQLALLTAVPGIGEKTARKLLLHFKTLRGVLTAPFNEVEKLVGKARAERLTEVLDTIYPPALEELEDRGKASMHRG